MSFEDRYPVGQSDPVTRGSVVTPSDSTTYSIARALWVGAAGNVAVTTVDGDVLTFVGVQAGTLLPVRVSKVMSTNTTASSILVLW